MHYVSSIMFLIISQKNTWQSSQDQQIPQQQCSYVDQSTKSFMGYLYPLLVDRQAEEFITEFYKEIRLQSQHSYKQEKLARVASTKISRSSDVTL